VPLTPVLAQGNKVTFRGYHTLEWYAKEGRRYPNAVLGCSFSSADAHGQCEKLKIRKQLGMRSEQCIFAMMCGQKTQVVYSDAPIASLGFLYNK
jgi:hypothetical protein